MSERLKFFGSWEKSIDRTRCEKFTSRRTDFEGKSEMYGRFITVLINLQERTYIGLVNG